MSTGPRSDPPVAGPVRWPEHARTAWGLAIITACFLAGDWLKRRFGLILPGSVLGLFLLLALLLAGVVRSAWVESASRLLIFILPVCFISLYVLAGADRALWREWGVLIAGTLVLTMVLLWIFAGTLAQWLLQPKKAEGRRMNLVIWSTATIVTFIAARWFFLRTRIQLLHPVLVTTLLLMLAVELTGRDYAGFAAGTGWLGWILGPGVVAMAVPVYKQRTLIWQRAGVLVLVVIATLLFSLFSTGIILALAGAEKELIQSLSLKNITSAVAMAIARDVHAWPALAGVGAMFAAVLGAAIGPGILQRAKVHDPRAVGLAMGCGSHAVGTARAFELGEEQGTFASVGLSLNTLAAAVICPPLLLWLFS